MIALIVGAPGSGKSYTSVALIAEALRAGRPVATNVELAEDWPELVVRTIPLWWVRGKAWRARRLAALERLVLISDDLSELFRVRLDGCASCKGCKSGRNCRKEGRGVMVLDEAHNWMNARTWDSDGQSSSKQDAVHRRLQVVKFFTQHRKLGWAVHLITQDENNIDRQVRTLFESLVRLRNLRGFKVMGLSLIPINLFLAIWTWNDPAKSVQKRQLRRLNRRTARMYDSMALSHGLEDAADELGTIQLPHPEPPARKDPDGEAAAPAQSAAAGGPGPVRVTSETGAQPVKSTEKAADHAALSALGKSASIAAGPDVAVGRLSNSRPRAKNGARSYTDVRLVRPAAPGG